MVLMSMMSGVRLMSMINGVDEYDQWCSCVD